MANFCEKVPNKLPDLGLVVRIIKMIKVAKAYRQQPNIHHWAFISFKLIKTLQVLNHINQFLDFGSQLHT